MQITAAIFFALSGHYSVSPLRKPRETVKPQVMEDKKVKKTLSPLFKERALEGKDFINPEKTNHRENQINEQLSFAEGFDLKEMRQKAMLSNRLIAETLGMRESVVSNAINKSGEIYKFLDNELNKADIF